MSETIPEPVESMVAEYKDMEARLDRTLRANIAKHEPDNYIELFGGHKKDLTVFDWELVLANILAEEGVEILPVSEPDDKYKLWGKDESVEDSFMGIAVSPAPFEWFYKDHGFMTAFLEETLDNTRLAQLGINPTEYGDLLDRGLIEPNFVFLHAKILAHEDMDGVKYDTELATARSAELYSNGTSLINPEQLVGLAYSSLRQVAIELSRDTVRKLNQ